MEDARKPLPGRQVQITVPAEAAAQKMAECYD
jgi:hypothetical protein